MGAAEPIGPHPPGNRAAVRMRRARHSAAMRLVLVFSHAPAPPGRPLMGVITAATAFLTALAHPVRRRRRMIPRRCLLTHAARLRAACDN